MPIHKGTDTQGYFYQWGNQKKYYYNPLYITSEKKAYNLALRQARAIHAHIRK